MTYSHQWGKSLPADKIMSLVSGFSRLKGLKRNIMVLQAYFDESDKRVDGGGTFVLAGFIASADKWAAFSEEWEAHLKANEWGAYKWLKFRRNEKINEDFYRIIEKHIVHCIYSVTDIGALHKAVEDFPWPKDSFADLENIKRQVKNPYHLAVKHVLLALADHKDKLGLTEPIHHIFDEKTEMNTVLGSYDFLKHSSDPILRGKMSGLSFMSDDEVLPLQAADLLAGWVRKSHMDGKDLRKGQAFPWKTKQNLEGLYIFQDYDFFIKELEYIAGEENLIKFISYANELADKRGLRKDATIY